MLTRSARRGLAILILLPFLAASVRAEEELPRMAAMNFKTNEKLDEILPSFNRKLRAAIRHHLKRDFDLVPTDEVQTAIVTADLTAREVMGNAPDAARLATALGVTRILVGHASGGKGDWYLKARVFNTDTGVYGEWATILMDDLNLIWDRTRPLIEGVGLLPRELREGPEYFEALPHSERNRIIRRQFRDAGADVRRLELLADWMTTRGLPEEAERCVDLVEEQETDSEWVAKRRGQVDLRETYARIPEDDLLFDHPNRACAELERMVEYAPNWGSRREQRKAERLIAEVERHLERLKTDERYLEEFGVILRVEKSPQFGDLHFQVRSRAPFLVFVEHEEYASPGRVAAAVETADRLLLELHDTWNAFLTAFAKDLDLPDIEAQKALEDRVFKVFLFKDLASFEAFHEDTDDPSPLRLLGPYYQTANQWVLAYPAANEAATGPILSRTRAAAARQIFHLMKKLTLAKGASETVLWSDPRLTGSLLWFELGLPTMVGAGTAPDRGLGNAMGVNQDLLDSWRSETGGIDFDVTTMMEIDDFGKLRAQWAMRGGKGGFRHGLELFEAQSWALCDYLWHRKKSRKGFLKYMRRELEGKSGARAFQKAIFGRGKPTWTKLEESWRKWVQDL